MAVTHLTETVREALLDRSADGGGDFLPKQLRPLCRVTSEERLQGGRLLPARQHLRLRVTLHAR